MGMALVKDHRIVMNLRPGDNTVYFTDVAATIDPTSVRFSSETDPVGTKVVEQNFEYDLISPAKLMEKYVGETVELVVVREVDRGLGNPFLAQVRPGEGAEQVFRAGDVLGARADEVVVHHQDPFLTD